MTLRLARPDDASPIAKVQVDCWRAAYRGLMPDAFLASLSIEQKTLEWKRALAEVSPGVTIVFERARHIIGFCVYGPSRDDDAVRSVTGEIVSINVLPPYWRQGIGKELCSYALNDANTRHWQSLTLWVIAQNSPARAFYERLGFLPDGTERRNYALIGSALLEMRYRKYL